jgi:ABC-type sulfate transport system permease component
MWLFLITIPFWTNLLIRTFAINEVIRNEGILNTGLIWLGVIDAPLADHLHRYAVLIGMVYVYLPLMVLPLYATIDRFDMRLLEASTTFTQAAGRCCAGSSCPSSSRGSSRGRSWSSCPRWVPMSRRASWAAARR